MELNLSNIKSKFILGSDDLEVDFMIKEIILFNLIQNKSIQPFLIVSKRFSTEAIALLVKKIFSDINTDNPNLINTREKSIIKMMSIFGSEHDHHNNFYFDEKCSDLLDFCAGIENKYQFIIIDNLENFTSNLADNQSILESYRIALYLSDATKSKCLIGVNYESSFGEFSDTINIEKLKIDSNQ